MTSAAFSRRSFARAASLPLVLVPVMAACGGSEAGGGGGGDASELRVAFPEDSENFDPHQLPQTVSRAVSRQIADTLVDQDPESGEIVPWLATDWEVSDDSTEFTFHLREDVTFSDGTELTAENVKTNFDRIIDIGPLAYIGASHLRGYAGTEVPDPYTAVVTFEEPNAQFLQAATTQTLSILADATFENTPEEVARGAVIGSGAYVFGDYSPGESLTLTRREDYSWGSSAYSNQGAAPYEQVTISFITDPTTLAGAVTSGQVDFGFLIESSTLPALEGSDQVTVVQNPVRGIASPLIPFIYRPIFADDAVRRAINPATDRQEILDRIYQGQGAPATGLLTAETPGAADLSDLLAHDPDAAIEILEEGGWTTVGDDGIRTNDDGDRLEITIMYSGSGTVTEQLFQLLQTQWKEVGIDFVLEPTTEAQMSDYTLYDAPYDLSTWSQGRADPDVLRVVYSSFYENQSFFYGNALPEIDDALLELQTTTDPDERDAASENAQRLLLEGGYSFPLTDQVSNSAHTAAVASIALDIENKPAFADFEVA